MKLDLPTAMMMAFIGGCGFTLGMGTADMGNINSPQIIEVEVCPEDHPGIIQALETCRIQLEDAVNLECDAEMDEREAVLSQGVY